MVVRVAADFHFTSLQFPEVCCIHELNFALSFFNVPGIDATNVGGGHEEHGFHVSSEQFRYGEIEQVFTAIVESQDDFAI